MQRGRETFAGHTAASPASRGRAIGQGPAAEHRFAGAVDAVSVGQALGPDAAVDNADDDVFALHGQAADQLRPDTARRGETQEGRGRNSVHLPGLVDLHVHHQRAGPQGGHFGVGQADGKAVVDRGITRHDRCTAHQRQHAALLVVEEAFVGLHRRQSGIEAGARHRLGGGIAGHGAGVAGSRLGGQLHDVGAPGLGLGLGTGGHQSTHQGQHSQRCGKQFHWKFLGDREGGGTHAGLRRRVDAPRATRATPTNSHCDGSGTALTLMSMLSSANCALSLARPHKPAASQL